ncbi:uncharacterized protein LOC121268379 isoform X2 [Juglans microcarpa x Juglans regia]|uniref:uncharacterized protein LOC121268379 isoform X2 n=1 Tax=Juglans microcarpa x Juglans regia TaxID=2249226 RepID=UPI001B7E478A|nr:uncharacterized protein LOC121268379 isoform X2 [Juglans microcarpa x Juglans regia]
MLSIQKWKCSWSLAAAIASIVALVSVVHLFLFPFGPSFDYFRETQNACVPINGSSGATTNHVWEDLQPTTDLDHRFPADLHKGVIYHDAPWKAEIGQWLSGCDSVTKEISIAEIIGAINCKNGCSGQGVCNRELGQCRCFHGYSGEGCSERLQLDCNFPPSPEQPNGRWVVSICPTYCDTRRAMCFCGEGTKYPNRPVPEACGFKLNLSSEPDAPKLTDWTKTDLDNIFTTNGSKPGWCNVDPTEAYSNKVQFKEECDCKYDGLWGRFCEVPVLCTCINQCSGHGRCRGGFCQCDNGWYGIDCSIPSVVSSVRDWPQWLRPARIDVPDDAYLTAKAVNLNAVVKKKRPLIYVYDLPPGFNSLLLEGRHFKLECVNRIYDDKNATLWTDQLYGAQMALYESILASSHRTLNGEEADFFFVPVLDACIITRADDAPHLSMQFFSWDEGACYAPKVIWSSMMLVHWGNTNSKHNHSTTAYWADNWDSIPSSRRGSHPCFEPEKDLVLPAWKRPDGIALSAKLWARPREKRKTLFYFNGNLGPAYPNGRPEASYSMGIRQKIAEEFGSSPDKEGKLGKQHTEDVIVTPLRSENYHEDLAGSVFCGVFPGDGWSGRMEDSILQGCIPVVIQDGIFLPYENVLNYESFAVRISENEIPNLIKILRGFNETEVEYKLANVRKIWPRFLYRDSIMLEAERQKTVFGRVEDWAVEFSQLIEDDVFATFIQVLHYKLHNDPWRRHIHVEKDFGLPRECLIGAN